MDARIALVVDCGFGTLEASHRSAARMSEHLRGRGFEVVALQGPGATRERVRGALAEVSSRLVRGDAFVFYFVGHGERVRDRAYVLASLERRPAIADLLLLITRDLHVAPDAERVGIAGPELLDWLRPIADATDNVTVILDCCHAAGILAGDAPRSDAARARLDAGLRRVSECVRAKYERFRGDQRPGLAAERRIVRLVATTQSELAMEDDDHDGERIGLFTLALLEALARPGARTWDALMPEVQARVLGQRPTQRPGIEGPRHRFPFTTEEQGPAGSVRCTLGRAGTAFLAAGRTAGVAKGDLFSLVSPDDGAPQALALVTGADETRATLRVRFSGELPRDLRAVRLRSARRVRVSLRAEPPALAASVRRAIAGAAIDLTEGEGEAVLELRGDRCELRDADGELVHCDGHVDGEGALSRLADALARLVHWTRVDAALRALLSLPDPPPLGLAWGRAGEDQALPLTGAELRAGERIWMRVRPSAHPELHVSAYHVRADRTIARLTGDLDPGVPALRSRVTELTLTPAGEPALWTVAGDPSGARREWLVVLASRQPLDFHAIEALAPPPATGTATRTSRDERPAIVRIEFHVLPRA